MAVPGRPLTTEKSMARTSVHAPSKDFVDGEITMVRKGACLDTVANDGGM